MRKRNGFTLIELLLYIGIAATIAFVVSLSLSAIYQSRIKNQTIAEVEQNGVQIMDFITQTARNADSINLPTQGNNGATLNLTMSGVTKIFDTSGSNIQFKDGSAPYITLTSDRVTTSNLNFTNLSRTGTSGTVKIQFTLTLINTAGRNEYNYSKTFYGSASLRPK